MDRPDPVPDSVAATRANVQASLLRAPKTGGDHQRTRNWALFVFFRIMSENELAATRERILALHDSAEGVAGEMGPQEKLRIDLAHPGVLNAALADPEAEAAPAEAFRNWLKALVSKDAEPMRATLAGFGEAIQAGMTVAAMADGEAEMPLPAGLDASPGAVHASAAVLLDLLRGFMTEAGYAHLVERAEEQFKAVAADDAAGPVLPPLLFYEFLRAGAPAFEPGRGLPPAIRSEADQKALAGDADNADRMPISFAFTHSGLQALRFDANTLASFPDAFKEGMAARARRLRDTGPSAPEYWEGELGLKSVHGYFTGGFGTHAYPTSEAFWKKLRAEARAFNDATDDAKEQLRELIGVLFRSVGLEIVHIELGQDPHQHTDDQAALLDPTARQTPRGRSISAIATISASPSSISALAIRCQAAGRRRGCRAGRPSRLARSSSISATRMAKSMRCPSTRCCAADRPSSCSGSLNRMSRASDRISAVSGPAIHRRRTRSVPRWSAGGRMAHRSSLPLGTSRMSMPMRRVRSTISAMRPMIRTADAVRWARMFAAPIRATSGGATMCGGIVSFGAASAMAVLCCPRIPRGMARSAGCCLSPPMRGSTCSSR
ncbi:hypothetical protein DAI00_13930 [Sphingomonas koreensis]|nr:hypothetical protein DAI00_13930 [Sphingomonas koreensis]